MWCVCVCVCVCVCACTCGCGNYQIASGRHCCMGFGVGSAQGTAVTEFVSGE